MRTATSIWFQYVRQLFGATAGRRWPRRADLSRRAIQPCHLAAEVLEERSLLSVAFDGVLSIGNDAGNSAARDVATDQAGNSFVAGYFRGTVDFDQGAVHSGDGDILTARGAEDGFVAKYAPDNSLVWVRRMGGDAFGGLTDSVRKIEVDTAGNVYVSGEFVGPSDFGSTILTTAGEQNGFAAKLSANGTIQWAGSLGTANAGTVLGTGISVDSAGNVYALRTRVGDGYDVVKFTSAGSTVWSRTIESNQVLGGGDLTVTGSGNVYLAGSFNGIVDFDPGPKTKYVSAGQIANKISEAGFVLKLDTNGKFGWVSPFVGQVVGANKGYAYANSVALDTSGNIVVGGSYRDTVDFNPGSGTTTLPALGGAFITKLNSSGGLVWARALVRSESSGTVTVGGLNVDSAGAIYATGGYRGTVDFDPGAGTVTQTSVEAGPSAGDIYVVKLSAAGSLSWVETFGGEGIGDFGSGIAVDPIGVIHVAGQFEGSVDFDPDPLATFSLIPGSYRKGFRLRLRQA